MDIRQKKISFDVKKIESFLFSISSFSFLEFSIFFRRKKYVVIAHNIYNFVYTATGYPAKETGYPVQPYLLVGIIISLYHNSYIYSLCCVGPAGEADL